MQSHITGSEWGRGVCEHPSGRAAGLGLDAGEGAVLVLPHAVHTLLLCRQGLVLDVTLLNLWIWTVFSLTGSRMAPTTLI